MKGYEVISTLKNHIGENDLIVSSNGNISREVFHFLPKHQVYLRGSMGLPVGVGVGLAVMNPQKRVIVITGDGNLLMGFGSVVTAAYYKPQNLKILILDNSQYFTTGGQETVSSAINYDMFLKSLNIDYNNSLRTSVNNITEPLEMLFSSKRFSILHFIIEEGKKELANIPLHPTKIAENFQSRFI
ncbi:MAG: thiamine pyrophosphate-dependent enzyme [Candidatus Hodarchaeales archaeon]|jgi:thiamine pyrophosphate-dependent acetolactate synthase large subunit-like protein